MEDLKKVVKEDTQAEKATKLDKLTKQFATYLAKNTYNSTDIDDVEFKTEKPGLIEVTFSIDPGVFDPDRDYIDLGENEFKVADRAVRKFIEDDLVVEWDDSYKAGELDDDLDIPFKVETDYTFDSDNEYAGAEVNYYLTVLDDTIESLKEDLEIDNIFAIDFPEATQPAGALTESDLTTEWLDTYNKIDVVSTTNKTQVLNEGK